jgi:hypothetical protein
VGRFALGARRAVKMYRLLTAARLRRQAAYDSFFTSMRHDAQHRCGRRRGQAVRSVYSAQLANCTRAKRDAAQ